MKIEAVTQKRRGNSVIKDLGSRVRDKALWGNPSRGQCFKEGGRVGLSCCEELSSFLGCLGVSVINTLWLERSWASSRPSHPGSQAVKGPTAFS